jgi:membrane-bound metal-dependent hydrolase YbcI (DUF457 family)
LPSPIAHSAMGYVIYRFSKRKSGGNSGENSPAKKSLLRYSPVHLMVIIGFSLIPDMDFVAGVLLGDLSRFHNNSTHSLIVGLGIALIFAFLFSLRKRSAFFSWFWLILMSYEMHIVLDFFTHGGRGVMLFWPLSTMRFDAPVDLFYGVRWSDGWISVNHLWTIVSEVGFVLLILLVFWLLEKIQSMKTGGQGFTKRMSHFE